MKTSKNQQAETPMDSCVPEYAVVQLQLTPVKIRKIRYWLDRFDHVELATGTNNRLFIFNRTMIEKLRRERIDAEKQQQENPKETTQSKA